MIQTPETNVKACARFTTKLVCLNCVTLGCLVVKRSDASQHAQVTRLEALNIITVVKYGRLCSKKLGRRSNKIFIFKNVFLLII